MCILIVRKSQLDCHVADLVTKPHELFSRYHVTIAGHYGKQSMFNFFVYVVARFDSSHQHTVPTYTDGQTANAPLEPGAVIDV